MSSKVSTEFTIISDICQRPGPFLSAYLDVSRNVDEAPHRLEVRWRSARDELLRAGAPVAAVDMVGERMLTTVGAPGRAARMIVAAGQDVLLDDVVLRPRAPEALTWGPLPDVTGWLTDRGTSLPLLVVLADREGADFELYRPWPERPVTRDSSHGDTEHLTKVSVGGWSHKRYQRRAEQTWRRNAEQVAAEIDELATDGVPLVAITGDVRAVGEVRQAVSEHTRSLLVELDAGGRAAGSSREALDDAIDHAVQSLVITSHLQVLRKLEQETGRHGAAVMGVPRVLSSLVHGQVRTVLMAPEVAATHTVRPDAHPGLTLPESALAHDRVRADLAVICAAAATDAETLMAPQAVTGDGVAALLRW